MMDSSDKVVFIADSSKFGKKAFSNICSWREVDTFVSDKLDMDFRKELEEMGVEVIPVNEEKGNIPCGGEEYKRGGRNKREIP